MVPAADLKTPKMYDNTCNSFLTAVREADLKNIKTLVNRYGLSYCRGWRNGYILLCDAIIMGHFAIAKFLLEEGAEVNPITDRISTPLHIAVEKNCVEIVRLLLERNAKVEARNGANETALHVAVREGYAIVAEVLLNNNADMKAEDDFGLNPLLLAISHEHGVVVEILLRHAFSASQLEDEENNLRLLKNTLFGFNFKQGIVNTFVLQIFAFNDNRRGYVDGLISRGIIRGNVDESLIRPAIEKYLLTIIEHALLPDTRKSLERCFPFILHTAVELRLTEVVRLLLSVGFNANARDEEGKPCLQYALSEQKHCSHFVNRENRKCLLLNQLEYVEMLKMLFDSGADIREAPQLLHLVARRRWVIACQLLIKNGADVNALDSDQSTPLHNITTPPPCHPSYKRYDEQFDSTREKSAEIAKILVDNGADLSIKAPDGLTAFHHAAKNLMIEIALVFLDSGVDANLRDEDGKTPLHWASLQPNGYGFVKTLCKKGADVDARQNNGWTPLQLVASTSHSYDGLERIEILLELGADINAQGSMGETPLHCTPPRAKEVLAGLLDNGGDINAVTRCGATALDTSIKACVDAEFNCVSRKLYEYLEVFNSFDNVDSDNEEDNTDDELRRVYQIVPDDEGPGILKRHIIKLEVAGLDVSVRNSDLVRRHRGTFPDSERGDYYRFYRRLTHRCRTSFAGFREQCQKEVDRMKNINLGSQFTLYDVLLKRENPTFLRNKSLIKFLKSVNFDLFPVYKSLIVKYVERSALRIKLMELGEDGLTTLVEESSNFTCRRFGKECMRCSGSDVKCALPNVVSELIVWKLSNRDLKSLISCSEALEPESNSIYDAFPFAEIHYIYNDDEEQPQCSTSGASVSTA